MACDVARHEPNRTCIRFRHPNIRNTKRIAEKENDIERKRLAREKIREQAEETELRAVWSEADTKLLIQLEEELQGTKNINIAIDEILKSKTAKQISLLLRGFCGGPAGTFCVDLV
jgi:hypothetical protein